MADNFGSDDPFGDAQFTSAPSNGSLAAQDIHAEGSFGAAPMDTGSFAAAPMDASMFSDEPSPTAPGFPPLRIESVVQLSQQESQAAFIGGYVPHVTETPAPLPGTPRSPLGEDPRVALNRKHQEFLLKKEKEEQASKKAAGDKGKAYIAKFNEDREKELAKAKKVNRESEKASPEAGVPSGSTWEKVNLLINHAHDKIHTKDLARFKSTLAACKALNVPVTAK